VSNYRGGPGPELYYSFSAAGTALATFTGEASLMGGYPIPQIPATFFSNVGEVSSAMKIRAYGNVGDTTSAPTFTFALRFQVSSGIATYSTSAIGWTSTAMTVNGTSQTNDWWQIDMDVTLRTLGAGTGSASSTLDGHGIVSGPGFSNIGSIPANGTAGTLTFDTTGITNYWLTLGCACSSSNGSNTINLQTLKIYLET
jgi:hypothetical protein